jgi:hypothetical protein
MSETNNKKAAPGVDVQPMVSNHLEPFDYYQFSDRCYCINTMIDESLREHPAYQEERIKKLIDEAFEKLATAYQLSDGIGYSSDKNFLTTKNKPKTEGI